MLDIEKLQNPLTARNNPRLLFTIFLISAFFLAFFLVTLQQIGTPPAYLHFLAFGLLFLIYPVIGFLSRTMQLDEYVIAGRRGVQTYNGMAIAAALLSGTAFVTVAGDIFNHGTRGLYWISALVLGLAVATQVLAPAIAKTAAITLPEFLVARDNHTAAAGLRLSTLLLPVVCSFLLLVGQLGLVQQVAASFFAISPTLVIVAGLTAVLTCLLPGGMRGLTWIRVALYVIVAIAFLLPITWISVTRTGVPLPHFSYGLGALEVLNSIEQELIRQGFEGSAALVPITGNQDRPGTFDTIVLLLCLAAGTAAMPHMLQHFATARTAGNARHSGNWAILFIVVVLAAAPAYAAFVKLEIYNAMVGLPLSELIEQVPWLFDRVAMEGKPLATLCGVPPVDLQSIINACSEGENHVLAPEDFSIHGAVVVLASGEIADLPPLVSTLIAIGAFAALFSTIDGLLLLIANTIAHDGYHMLLRPHAPKNTVLFVSRFALIAATALAGYLALVNTIPVALLVTASFSLAAAGLFPALMMKALWKRPSNKGLLAGVLSGTLVAGIHAFVTLLGSDLVMNSGDENAWFALAGSASFQTLHSGFLGMLVGFVVIIATSLLQKRKSGQKADALA